MATACWPRPMLMVTWHEWQRFHDARGFRMNTNVAIVLAGVLVVAGIWLTSWFIVRLSDAHDPQQGELSEALPYSAADSDLDVGKSRRHVPGVDLFQTFTFEAAHRLPQITEAHKCVRLHGHSFRVELHTGREFGGDNGLVLDCADVSAAFRPVHDRLNYHYLNEIDGLENPTSERLSIWIWERLKPALPRLSAVAVHETCTAGCRYRGK